MNQEEYKAIWEKLFDESISLAIHRSEIENELNEVNTRLQNIRQALQYMRPLAGAAAGDDLRGLGITDAVRAVLQKSKQRMSATDIRNALTARGFDLSGYSSAMSSIYTVLGRLADDPNTPVIRHKEEGGTGVSYEWKEPEDDVAQSAEITDDDIPF
jgi:hypothetical protein